MRARAPGASAVFSTRPPAPSTPRCERTRPDSGPLAQFLIYDAPLSETAASLAWLACDGPHARVDWQGLPGRAAFDASIARIHRSIEAGELYQANYTAPLTGRAAGDPLALFGALRRAQPNAYAAYIRGGGDADTVLSVSPELFFDWRDDRLLASPMKGTAPRGASPVEDAALREGLKTSDKG